MKRRDFLTAGAVGAAGLGLGSYALADTPLGLLGDPDDLADVTARRVRGIRGRRAPDLAVDTWFNLPRGSKSIDLGDYANKVVYLYFFQSWCPGCHKSGFPTLQKVSRHFANTPDVRFAAIQTVFEGFGSNTADKARAIQKRYKLDMPVGHDAGKDDRGSRVMRKYRSGGTPWTVIVDKSRVVRFNAFHIRPQSAISLMEKLRRG